MSFIIPALFVLMLLSGVPLFAVIGGATYYLLVIVADVDPMAIMGEIYRLTGLCTLIALPLFCFAGYLLSESKTPQRLVNFGNALLGSVEGGVAIATLVVCAVFTAFSGASGITIVALGGLLLPVVVGVGYSKKFSLGLITTCGSLGLLFPPSLPVILYALVAKVSMQQLFIGGIVPGMLLIALLALYCIFSKKLPQDDSHNSDKWDVLGEGTVLEKMSLWKATKDIAWELPIGIFVPLLIYMGWGTINEVATIAILYILVVEVFIYRDIKIREVPKVALDSMKMIGALMVIMGVALGFTNFLLHKEIPMMIVDWMQQFIHSKFTFLLVLNGVLLVVGCMMDIFSAIMVVVPLLVPVALSFGVDPVHLGVIFLVNLEIGYCTPPVGLNLFISSIRFKRPITDLYRATLPFLGVLIIALLLVTYFPSITLWLVHVLTGEVHQVGVLG